jgi:DNA-binding GntR family transcriptional regulator
MIEPFRLKPELKVVKLTKETLQDRVYRQVLDMILDGGIAPGQLVTIPALVEAFGVSAMPIREALRRLTAENALTVVSGRSIGIPKLSRTKLSDLRAVRIEVECASGAWGAERITAKEVAELRQHLKELDRANATGDVKLYLRANRAFHFAIYRAAGSEIMLGIIENLWLQISPYFNLLHGSGNYAVASRHHLAMMEALEQRNPGAIREAIRQDIEAAYDVLVGLVD